MPKGERMTEETTILPATPIIIQPEPQMRIVNSPLGLVVPLVDIADYIGYKRGSLNKATKGYEGKISPCKTFVTLQTPGGNQRFVCLNRTGVNYLLLLIHPSKSRMTLDELLEFRKSILQKMDDSQKESTPLNPSEKFKFEMQNAKMIAGETGQDLKPLQIYAMEKAGLADWIPITFPVVPQKEILQLTAKSEEPRPLQLAKAESGWANLDAISKALNGMPKTEINILLQNLGYQESQHIDGFENIWCLTEQGKGFGEYYQKEIFNKYKAPAIRWKVEIIKVLERELIKTVNVFSVKDLTEAERMKQMHEAPKRRDY